MPTNLQELIHNAINSLVAARSQPAAPIDWNNVKLNYQDPNFIQTEAQSRFTRTPIAIQQDDAFADYKDPSEGAYNPKQNQIYITVHSKTPYKDLARTIHHEDIHAALRNTPTYDVPDPRLNTAAIASLIVGNRGGNPYREAPAYTGTFYQPEMPTLTPEEAAQYQQQYQKLLSPNISQLLQRIISSYQASQK